MATPPDFDLSSAHRYFSVHCFNRAWDLIDKPDRTRDEDEEMLRLSLAAHWHWTQRDDYTPESASVGYWQTARIYALLGQAENARRYGLLSLAASQTGGVSSFYQGYAYEALARAEVLAGDRAKMDAYLSEARRLAASVADAEERQALLDDLATIQM